MHTACMAIIRKDNGHMHMVSGINLESALGQEETWARELREALAELVAYNKRKHEEFAWKMDTIEGLLGNYSSSTIFDHVQSIFDDAVT